MAEKVRKNWMAEAAEQAISLDPTVVRTEEAVAVDLPLSPHKARAPLSIAEPKDAKKKDDYERDT